MKKLPHYLVLLLVLLQLTAGAQSRKNKVKDGLLYEISGNGLQKPSYVFGTYHLLKDSYLTEQPQVKAKFEAAEAVVVEVILDSAELGQVAQLSLMPDNRISNLLDTAAYRRVDKAVRKAVGAELRMLDQFKPAALAMLLAVQQYAAKEEVSRYSGQPLDQYFAEDARKRRKPVMALETVKQQMSLIIDFYPLPEQAKQLVLLVDNEVELQKVMDELTAAYLQQDLQQIWDVSRKQLKAAGSSDHLIRHRNEAWAQQLPALLQQQSTFVAVGALHLPGEHGLLALLRKAGYKVTPVRG